MSDLIGEFSTACPVTSGRVGAAKVDEGGRLMGSSLWYTAWVRAGKPAVGNSRKRVKQSRGNAPHRPYLVRERGSRFQLRRSRIVVMVLLLVAFGLGVLVGYRRGPHSAPTGTPYAVPGSPGAAETAGCVDFREAGAHTGQTGCVSGRILRVFTSRAGNTYLDFCPDYRDCPFSSVIFASDRAKFGDLGSLEGRKVELRGPISVYQGRAQIIVHDPQQIRVAP